MDQIDFVPYPPTSFPYRDLLVLEQLPVRSQDRVCEIGLGSGETAARLARISAEVTGFEISAPTVEALRYLERRHPNLHLVQADATDLDQLAGHAGRFDRALSCDTLEHVPDPAAFFRGVASLLRPGGEFVVTFPNEPREKMHGITRFDTTTQLSRHVRGAGLADVCMGAARLTPHAQRVADSLGWKPLGWARDAAAVGRSLVAPLRRGVGSGAAAAAAAAAGEEAAPQTFEETRFFRSMSFWRSLAPAVNLYWYGVLRLMAARGPSFEVDWDFADSDFGDCQVLVTGRKPLEAAARA
jgi:SAM-dependent methyltransferase